MRGGRKFELGADGLPSELLQKVETPLFKLTEQDNKPVFQGAKQKGFEARRLKNLKRGERAQRHREVIARLCVSDIQAFHLTDLVRLMNEDGYEGATQRQEIAILSSFIMHAMKVWNWPLARNPALQFEWPIGTERDRVMTDEESKRLAMSLPTCGNAEVISLEMTFDNAAILMCWRRNADSIVGADANLTRVKIESAPTPLRLAASTSRLRPADAWDLTINTLSHQVSTAAPSRHTPNDQLRHTMFL